MFHKRTISALAVVLFLAVAFGQGLLALLCLALILIAGMAGLWSRWSLLRVSYTRSFSQTRAFPDDEVELTIRITNRKALPLAGLQVFDHYPAGLELINAPTFARSAHSVQLLNRRTSLRWYESVVWRYKLRCPARGSFKIGPVELSSGDPFGIYTNQATLPVYDRLLVYPRLLALSELGLPAHNPLGDVRSGLLLRDPLRVVGVRDYAPGDPLKDVHWAATARTGSLQTRIYEPTTSHVLAIFLDLDTFAFYYEGIDPAQVERVISATATLSQAGLEAGYAVGLYANGAPAEDEHLARLPPGRSPAQQGQILETLARLTAYSVTPISRLLQLTAHDLPPGSTVLLISCVDNPGRRAALLRLRELGYRVAWLAMGETAPQVPGVRVHHAPPATREETVHSRQSTSSQFSGPTEAVRVRDTAGGEVQTVSDPQRYFLGAYEDQSSRPSAGTLRSPR
jgi:uncharacterized protein (DUF58 family)